MSLDVRTIDRSEYPEWIRTSGANFFRAFHGHGAAEREAERRAPSIDFDRVQAAFDDKRMVGTFLSFATELTVPGGVTLPTDAISGVTVLPTHRRRGLLGRMMANDLHSAWERGEAVALLVASEYPLYGRYGFGPAVAAADYTVDTREARFAHHDDGRAGTLELVDAERMRAAAPEVYERFRLTCPGAVVRDGSWWDRTVGLTDDSGAAAQPFRQHVLHLDADGNAQGYLSYHIDESEGVRHFSRVVLVVDHLCALTKDAYARLWRYCCEADLVGSVQAPARSLDERLPWLLADARAIRLSDRVDQMWARILDPAAALAGRGYLAGGSVVVEVVDRGGYASGRFALDGDPDEATCEPTTAPADLTMPVQALGAAYLGGVTLRTLAAAGQVDEHRPGALARADVMFRSPDTPWCPITF